mgnify:CR=1 FL=1
MAEFKIIETQEQLDAIIGERLARQKETMEKKYADYLSPDDFTSKSEGLSSQIAELSKSLDEANSKISAFDSTIAEKDATIKKYETDSVKRRVLASMDMPYELADRLTGETEEDIRKDAEILQKFVGKRTTAPEYKSEPLTTGADSTDNALKGMLRELKGE